MKIYDAKSRQFIQFLIGLIVDFYIDHIFFPPFYKLINLSMILSEYEFEISDNMLLLLKCTRTRKKEKRRERNRYYKYIYFTIDYINCFKNMKTSIN